MKYLEVHNPTLSCLVVNDFTYGARVSTNYSSVRLCVLCVLGGKIWKRRKKAVSRGGEYGRMNNANGVEVTSCKLQVTSGLGGGNIQYPTRNVQCPKGRD